MDVYIDPIAPTPSLYVIGAGHVGWHLGRIAADAGFRLHVVDDREKFANAERFPAAETIEVDDLAAWLHRAELPPTAYVVVVTRGHTHDFEAVRALAARDLRYLGLIGSRAKVARIFEALEAEGMPLECLGRVHAPIGLDIGAITPAEIAISILAELIAIRHGKDVSAVVDEVDAEDGPRPNHEGHQDHEDHKDRDSSNGRVPRNGSPTLRARLGAVAPRTGADRSASRLAGG